MIKIACLINYCMYKWVVLYLIELHAFSGIQMYETSLAFQHIGSVKAYKFPKRNITWESVKWQPKGNGFRDYLRFLYSTLICGKNKYEHCTFKNPEDVWSKNRTTKHVSQSIRWHSRTFYHISPSFSRPLRRTTSLPVGHSRNRATSLTVLSLLYVEPRLSQFCHGRKSSHISPSFGMAVSRATSLQVLTWP